MPEASPVTLGTQSTDGRFYQGGLTRKPIHAIAPTGHFTAGHCVDIYMLSSRSGRVCAMQTAEGFRPLEWFCQVTCKLEKFEPGDLLASKV